MSVSGCKGITVQFTTSAKEVNGWTIIETPFGIWTQVGLVKHVLHGGAHWLHLANTIELSMCCGDAAFCQITLTTCFLQNDNSSRLAVWRSGNGVGYISEFILRGTRWAVEWLAVFRSDKSPRYVTSRQGQLSLLPSAGRELSTGQSAGILWGWGVKAGLAQCIVKSFGWKVILCDPLLTRSISERQ